MFTHSLATTSQFLPEQVMSTTHLCYVAIGVCLTIWVGRTLRIHGRIFLDKGCKGDTALSEALSHLLSVGFYLLHIGCVLLTLKLGGHVTDVVSAIELLSTKIGFVLVVLAVSHFLNIALYARIHGKPKPPLETHSTTKIRTAMDH